MVSSILPKNKQDYPVLSIFCTQDSEFFSFFGRIEETIICFRDCLTFSTNANKKIEAQESSLLKFVLKTVLDKSKQTTKGK